jgi:putative transposase
LQWVRLQGEEKGIRRSKFTEDEILGIIMEAEVGVKPQDVCRRHGISLQTFYRWKGQFSAADGAEMKALRLVEAENRRLKQVVAQLSLDNQTLKAALKGP